MLRITSHSEKRFMVCAKQTFTMGYRDRVRKARRRRCLRRSCLLTGFLSLSDAPLRRKAVDALLRCDRHGQELAGRTRDSPERGEYVGKTARVSEETQTDEGGKSHVMSVHVLQFEPMRNLKEA